MRVRMHTTAAGPAGVYLSGSTVDVPDEQAAAFIVAGYATAAPLPPVAAPIAAPDDDDPPPDADPPADPRPVAVPLRRRRRKAADHPGPLPGQTDLPFDPEAAPEADDA